MKVFLLVFLSIILNLNYTLSGQSVQTIVGKVGTKSGSDALSVRLGVLNSGAIDNAGNIYFTDDYFIMKKDAASGLISVFAGTGEKGLGGSIPVAGTCATCVDFFDYPTIGIDQNNSLLYITANDLNMYKVDLKTNILYSAAGGEVQYGSNNGDGGLASGAKIPAAKYVQIDSIGNIYFSQDFLDNRIRKIEKSTGIITTILGGNFATPSLDGSLGTEASITSEKFAIDKSGNVYYFDNYKLRKLSSKLGTLSTIAGKTGINAEMFGIPSGDGGLAINANIGFIQDIRIDNQNNIYFIQKDKTLRKINSVDSKISTIAGVSATSNVGEASGDGGLAINATFNQPITLTTDKLNNIYIFDLADHSIRKIDFNSKIITKVIGAGTYSGDGGLGVNANLSEPGSIVLDKLGNIYLADVLNHRIRKFTKSTGIISTIAGNGKSVEGNSGTFRKASYNGKNAVDVSINTPVAMGLDNNEINLYFVDNTLGALFEINVATGKINVVMGELPLSELAEGSLDGARLYDVNSLRFDKNNDVFIADGGINIIRKINLKTKIITTVAGSYIINNTQIRGYSGDGGPAKSAKISFPRGITFDSENNLFFVDANNQVIRKIDNETSNISTIAGMPYVFGFSGDGSSAKDANLWNPNGGIVIDKLKNILYFTDNDNNRIRRVNLNNGIISTLVGTGKPGFNGDSASPLDTKISISRSFLISTGIGVDSIGNVYFSDTYNNLIRKVVDPFKVVVPTTSDTLVPHKITIHKDKFVSLEMEQKEYDEWVKEDFFTYNVKQIPLLREIYNRFEDDFDFLICNLNERDYGSPTKISYGGVNSAVSNKVTGIGLDITDIADSYGSSNGRLKATIQLVNNAITNTPLLHEIAHTFANFAIDSVGFEGIGLTEKALRAHFGFTGGNTAGQLGGFVQSSLKENIDGATNKYSVSAFGQIANGGNRVPYNEFELYLMGLIPLNDVKPFDVFRGIQNTIQTENTTTFTANSRTTYNKELIEKKLGARVPSSSVSQKDFNALFIVLTPRPLTSTEIDQYDSEIIKMTMKGDDGTNLYNFWEATNGLGSLNVNGLNDRVATGTIVKLDTSGCSTNIRFKAYPLMNGGIKPKYQWFKNGVEINEMTSSLIYFTDLVNNDLISCKISNSIDYVIAEHKYVSGKTEAPTIFGDVTYCQGASNVNALTAKSTLGFSLKWYGTDASGGIASTTAPIPSINIAGTKEYYVSQISEIGCESARVKIKVVVKSAPDAPAITNSSPLIFCAGQNVVLTSTGVNNQWYLNGDAINNATTETLTVNASGTYKVKVISGDCSSQLSSAATVLVNPIPSIPTITLESNGGLTSSASDGNQWYFNDVKIDNATQKTINPTQIGSYTVKVTKPCESEISKPYTYNLVITSTEETILAQIQLSPNPFSNQLKINFPVEFGKTAQVKIVNMAGTVHFKKSSIIDGELIELSNLNGGNYILHLNSNDNMNVKSIKISKIY